MSQKELLKQIRKRAQEDKIKRKDPRFLTTMGFLVAKGFLKTNQDIPRLPNKKIRLANAIWAGLHVEPRILEVLPAAVLRLENHFDLKTHQDEELVQVLSHLRKQLKTGPTFHGVPYEKIKTWVDHPLPDKRTKRFTEKKITTTFRLDPAAHELLKMAAREKNCTVTETLEKLIFGNFS